MSQRQMRAMAVLLLHHQAFAGAPPSMPPPAIVSAACVPLPWYRRLWLRLRDQYLLTGWPEE